MTILCEACDIGQPDARTEHATYLPLLAPTDEDDDASNKQAATIDGKEQSTCHAAARDAEDDDIKQPSPPPPPEKTYREGDVVDFFKALRFCRPGPSVELLAVYPYFPFVGDIIVADENGGQYVYHQEEGEPLHNLDPEDNLVLTGPFQTISGFGSGVMRIKIPDRDRPGIYDTADLWFGPSNTEDDEHEDRLITTRYGRHLVVSYVTMREGLEVNVRVSIRLFGGGDDASHTMDVYGQITAHNRIFEDDSLLLFYYAEEEKVQLTPSAGGDGSVHLRQMQRYNVTVPINPQPFLTIKVNLKVTSPSNESATIAFKGDVEFPLDMAQRVRAIRTEHGEVQVRISYN
ncbi:hypothetical protein VPH35_092483 [Triticum aestivum]|uniref:DUF6598 domain-containing protein n=1 Tax=Triticum turgidum subsp. durum TaxID=4567 RepID=A0A9R0XHN3_TRITD|nr:unnamed protein product [Triticum turgidum subsp. durum]